MLYREVGQFKASYTADQAIFPIRQDRWFIAFGDEEFGPYQSEREALLFAIDAAHGLGEKGEETQVLELDQGGSTQPVWTYGIDPYPPGL